MIYLRRLLPTRPQMPARPFHKFILSQRLLRFVLRSALALALVAVTGWPQEISFVLRNGDRVTGTIVATNLNEVIVNTSFAGRITISSAQIDHRENAIAKPNATIAPQTNAPTILKPPLNAVAPASSSNQGKTNQTSAQVVSKPVPPKPGAGQTNQPSALQKFFSTWKGELELGLNLGFGSKERQNYAGRFKAAHLYTLSNQRTLKNDLDYIASYGKADGVLADNRMDGSLKTEYDIGKKFSIYNAIGSGYDEIRKIDLRYDLGPGVGYKWLNRTNYVLLTELGGNYQEQFFANDGNQERYSFRIAEQSWWQVATKIRADEKVEFFPEINRLGDYRVRGEVNLSYLFHSNLALKLTVIDLYETDPAKDVARNDLQILSSIGIKF